MISHRVGGNRKRNQQSMNADQKSIKTVFSLAICRLTGDKWQTKTLFQLIFLSLFLHSIGVFDCRLPCVVMFRDNPGMEIVLCRCKT